jgi:hypothetical protein
VSVFAPGGQLAVPAGPPFADPRSDVLSAAQRCNAIADYRVWLDCYCGAAQWSLLRLSPVFQVGLVPLVSYHFQKDGRFVAQLPDSWEQIPGNRYIREMADFGAELWRKRGAGDVWVKSDARL